MGLVNGLEFAITTGYVIIVRRSRPEELMVDDRSEADEPLARCVMYRTVLPAY